VKKWLIEHYHHILISISYSMVIIAFMLPPRFYLFIIMAGAALIIGWLMTDEFKRITKRAKEENNEL